MKNKFVFLSFILLFSLKLAAQNPAVIFPPNYYNSLEGKLYPLPIPEFINYDPLSCNSNNIEPNDPASMFDGYDGQQVTGASNMMMDKNGRILFFIVDGFIFNSKGVTKGMMAGVNYDHNAYGSNEITIVPDPGNCDRYYIFTNVLQASSQAVSSSPSICLYNTATEEIEKYIGLYSIIGAPTPGIFPNLTGSEIANAGGSRWGDAAIAATKKRADGSYNVIFSLTSMLFIVGVNDSGIYPVNKFDKPAGANLAANGARPIMELFEDASTNSIRIAISANAGSNSRIDLYRFSSNFSNVYTDALIQINDYVANDPTDRAFVKGLEFSPNGNYLYFTHNTSSLVSGQFKYVDLSNYSVNNLTVPSGYNIQNSEIETRKVNNVTSFMLAHQGGLLSYSNPNNPGLGSFQNLSQFSNYYNFGIDVSTQQSKLRTFYQLPDQIDELDYSKLKYMIYDASTFNACVSGTWEPNTGTVTTNNPFTTSTSDHIYIKEKLIIPAGKNITIKNMTFHFAPGAKVEIERGINSGSKGGRLTLTNSVFTVDDRCYDDEMWLGVEVLGYSTAPQFSASNTPQGSISVINNSRIEHAYVGIMASKRLNPLQTGNPSYDNNYNGGIVTIDNSTFFNNYIGVSILSYTSPLNLNNLSKVNRSKFIWDGPLKKQNLSYNLHAFIQNTKGIVFSGNEFSNLTKAIDFPTLAFKGYGIFARNSDFSVVANCALNTCLDASKNRFTNLYTGIMVQNTNGNPFLLDRSIFTDCWTGVFVTNAKNERITRNRFLVKEATSTFARGAFITNSTGYTIEENFFTNFDDPSISLQQSKNLGLIINNSGTAQNWVYKNSFNNLNVGGQSQLINGIKITDFENNTGTDPNDLLPVPTMRGLVWKCNTFSKINEFDMTVYNGRIDYNQGTKNVGDPVKYATNNVFSLTNEDPSLQHDIRIYNAQKINYVHLSDANQVPDSRTTSTSQSNNTGIVYADPALDANSQPVYTNSSACPSNFKLIDFPDDPNPGPGVIIETARKKEAELLAQIEKLKKDLDAGASPVLVTLAKTVSPILSLPVLLESSPYLSDQVIEEFIKKNPTSGQLKQLLIANSSLSSYIKTLILGVSMPAGTRAQIDAVQGGISPRKMLENQIDYLNKDLVYRQNIIISGSLMDSVDVLNSEAILRLEQRNTLGSKLDLFDIYLNRKDVPKQTEVRNKIIQLDTDPARAQITALQMEIATYSSIKDAFVGNSSLKTQLLDLRNTAQNLTIQQLASLYIANETDTIIADTVYYYPVDKNGVPATSQFENMDQNVATQKFVSIYPNPSTGIVNLDFSAFAEATLQVQVFDLSGKMMYNNQFSNTNGETISLSHLNKGVYLLKVLIDNETVEVQKVELK